MVEQSISTSKRPDLVARNKSKKQRAAVSRKNTTHGMSKHPLYPVWKDIRRRCYCPSRKRWEDYGGRGIGMCKRWRDWFPNFVKDMGLCPSPNHSIDRIDNDWHYEPGNCRWANHSTQALNSRLRTDNTSGVRGISQRKNGQWRAYYSEGGKQIMKDFTSKERAITWRKQHVK